MILHFVTKSRFYYPSSRTSRQFPLAAAADAAAAAMLLLSAAAAAASVPAAAAAAAAAFMDTFTIAPPYLPTAIVIFSCRPTFSEPPPPPPTPHSTS